MLRRIILLCGALLVGVIVLSGVALAQDIRGTFGQDDLTGTNQLDRIYGLGAADTIVGLGGNDDCYGGSGDNDTAYVDNQDIVKQNCENIWEAQAQ
jgi:Ca2+-binding RTX toxin-like protein